MEQRSQASLLACTLLACCYCKSFCNVPCLRSRKQKDLQKHKCVSISRQAQKESTGGGGRQTFLVKAIYKMEGGNTKYLSCLLGPSTGIAKPFPKWASQSISKMLMCAHWNLKRDGKKGKEKKKRHTGSTLDFFFLSFSLFSRKARAVVQSEDSCSDNGAWEN